VAFDFVAPLAVKLREKLPEIRLEVLTTVRLLDLARGEADLAIRYRAPSSRELVSVGSVTMPNEVVVARSYAARLKKKPRLEDLDWIAWAPPFDDLAPNPELAAMVPDFRPVFTSDSQLVQWRACEAGVGAMLRGHRFPYPSPVIALDIDLGPHATSTLHLVCARSALAVPRIRAVVDLVLAAFQAEEGR
jgi:DNA-binding transcriptional LysR family regulator